MFESIEGIISEYANYLAPDEYQHVQLEQARAELAAVRELFEASQICDCANSIVETRLSKAVAACRQLTHGE